MRSYYPISSPSIGLLEKEYVAKAMESGWVSSQGPFIDEFENAFSAYCGVEYGITISSGTSALFLVLKALGIGQGNEVIVPALTFAAVPASVVHTGAKPVFADVSREYWCISSEAIERAVTSKTKAIIVVHNYGHPAEMTSILKIAQRYNLKVIEDCAEAHGALYKGQKVGSLGDIGCFSFYGNKIITTGEGGMCVTNDKDIAKRVAFLRSHAMQPDRPYYHTEIGYNHRMSNLQAALGCAQLHRINELLQKRATILSWYCSMLKDAEVSLNPNAPWATPVNWMVCVVLPRYIKDQRRIVQDYLKTKGIDTRPFFMNAHEMPPYVQYHQVGVQGNNNSISAWFSRCGFNLPSSPDLTEDDVSFIAKALLEVL